jgi:glutaminase
MLRMAGGGTIGFNNSVFLAEREHADRNFALSYQLKVGIITIM